MRKNIPFLLCIIFVFLFLPMVCLFSGASQTVPPPTPDSPAPSDSSQETVSVLDPATGKVRVLSLIEYLTGVTAAQCLPDGEPEAIKALVIAARSRLEYRKACSSHENGAVCTDGNHCDSFWTEEETKQNWGTYWFGQYYPVLQDAVAQVAGQVLTYEGKPVLALSHALSSGQTETAGEFGLDLPWIIGTDSPFDITANNYSVTVRFSAGEFKERMLSSFSDTDWSAPEEQWVADIQTSSAGGVISLTAGGRNITGQEFASALGLPSNHFTTEYRDGKLIFTVTGMGNGFGISRYGANELAKRGYDAEAILRHYFSVCEIQSFQRSAGS